MYWKRYIHTRVFCLEYCVLVRYYFLGEIIRQPTRTILRLGQYLLVAILVAFTYFDPGNYYSSPNKKAAVLATSRFLTSLTSLPFLSTYLSPDRIIILEGLNGIVVSPTPLILAKFTVYVILRELLILLYGLIVYPLTGLRPGLNRFFIYIVILWTHQLAKSSLGFFISATFSSTPLADFILATAALLNLLFGGGITTGTSVPAILWWLRFLSATFYANQALLYNQFGEGWKWKKDSRNPRTALPQSSSTLMPPWFCITMGMIHVVVFLSFSILTLSYTTTSARTTTTTTTSTSTSTNTNTNTIANTTINQGGGAPVVGLVEKF